MTKEERYTLIELLEKLRDYEIAELAEENNMTEGELRRMLEREPEDVYDMDDGNCLLESIDNIIWSIS